MGFRPDHRELVQDVGGNEAKAEDKEVVGKFIVGE